MSTPCFSILIPAITERLNQLRTLCEELENQIAASKQDVEIVSVVDNRKVSVGRKRQSVLDASHGHFVAFVDDDDWIMPNYVERITSAIMANKDLSVVTFNNISYINQNPPAIVEMRLGNPNEPYRVGGFKRAAWHVCAWNVNVAKHCRFPDHSYGEDWAWAEQCNALAKTEHHIPEILHVYRHDMTKSRALKP